MPSPGSAQTRALSSSQPQTGPRWAIGERGFGGERETGDTRRGDTRRDEQRRGGEETGTMHKGETAARVDDRALHNARDGHYCLGRLRSTAATASRITAARCFVCASRIASHLTRPDHLPPAVQQHQAATTLMKATARDHDGASTGRSSLELGLSLPHCPCRLRPHATSRPCRITPGCRCMCICAPVCVIMEARAYSMPALYMLHVRCPCTSRNRQRAIVTVLTSRCASPPARLRACPQRWKQPQHGPSTALCSRRAIAPHPSTIASASARRQTRAQR